VLKCCRLAFVGAKACFTCVPAKAVFRAAGGRNGVSGRCATPKPTARPSPLQGPSRPIPKMGITALYYTRNPYLGAPSAPYRHARARGCDMGCDTSRLVLGVDSPPYIFRKGRRFGAGQPAFKAQGPDRPAATAHPSGGAHSPLTPGPRAHKDKASRLVGR
jgi:hypothetical protein